MTQSTPLWMDVLTWRMHPTRRDSKREEIDSTMRHLSRESSTGILLSARVSTPRKLYGFAAASIIHYCKSVLATLVKDAVIDSDGSIRWACAIHFMG